MTLIITSVCKDGVCVCADKRRIIKYYDGRQDIKDDLYKIYKFKKIQVIIFNHGINVINKKPWDVFCSDYDKSERWKGLKLKDMVNDFKNFVESDVLDELRNNRLYNAIGFLICGITPSETTFQAHELFWSSNFERKVHKGLIRTGTGSVCLEEILRQKPQLNTIEYWSGKTTKEAEKEIEQLFKDAVRVKNERGIQEFSDQYDILVMTDK